MVLKNGHSGLGIEGCNRASKPRDAPAGSGIIRKLSGLFRKKDAKIETEPFIILPPEEAPAKGDAGLNERRGALLYIAFKNKRLEYAEMGVLSERGTVDLLYSCIWDFERLMGAMGMGRARPEEEGVRAKSDDRAKAIADIERMAKLVDVGERKEAIRIIADMAVKMRETLCSKEVCERVGKCVANLENAEGSKIEMLRDMAAFLLEHGAKPSGKNMRSGVPRAEKKEMEGWMAIRPKAVMEMAAKVVEREGPASMEMFMKALETDPCESDEKRLFVGEVVLGRAIGPDEFLVLSERVAGNVAYYCINEIVRVTTLADSIDDEGKAEQAKKDAVDAIMAIAKRMPEGRRMDAPGMVADLAKILVEQGKPEQWIITGWLSELAAYLIEPDRERAFNKLSRLRVRGTPMEALG